MKFAVRRSLWHGRSGTGPRARSTSACELASPLERGRHRDPVRGRRRRVRLDDAEGVEPRRNRRPPVDRAQRLCDAPQRLRLPNRLRDDDLALDEARDEITLGLDERDHVRPDADGGRREGRLVLCAPVDPEQLRVAAADPEHVDAPVDGDLEVAIRDPAAERLDPGVAAGPDPLDHLLDPRHVERS